MGKEENLSGEMGVLGPLSQFMDLVEGWSLCAITEMTTQHTHSYTASLTHAASTVTHVGLAALQWAADLHTEGLTQFLAEVGTGERTHLSWAGCGPG